MCESECLPIKLSE